ncbi:MAG TPA: hypothetical protein VFQ35_17910, partial [Polyangiaceae bacterium]|nr:hypothetical protein [Polyangiaceae bacterium]
MDERTLSKVWAALKRPTRRALIVLGAALLGCSSAMVLYSSRPRPPEARPPNVVSTSSASAPAVSQAIQLEDFSPLPTDPALRNVADALELSDFARAAEALSLAQKAEPRFATPTVTFWLGRLWERAGNAAAARAACESARIPGSLLHDYAELCRARAALSLGDAKTVASELG